MRTEYIDDCWESGEGKQVDGDVEMVGGVVCPWDFFVWPQYNRGREKMKQDRQDTHFVRSLFLFFVKLELNSAAVFFIYFEFCYIV